MVDRQVWKGGNKKKSQGIKLRELQPAIKKRFGLKCTISQFLQVKKIALSKIEKTLAEHYEGVWDYKQEILNTNLGNTVQIRSNQGNYLTYLVIMVLLGSFIKRDMLRIL